MDNTATVGHDINVLAAETLRVMHENGGLLPRFAAMRVTLVRKIQGDEQDTVIGLILEKIEKISREKPEIIQFIAGSREPETTFVAASAAAYEAEEEQRDRDIEWARRQP